MSPPVLNPGVLALLLVIQASTVLAQSNVGSTNNPSAAAFNACVGGDNIRPYSPINDPTYLAPASFPQSPLSTLRCARASGEDAARNRAQPERNMHAVTGSSSSGTRDHATAKQPTGVDTASIEAPERADSTATYRAAVKEIRDLPDSAAVARPPGSVPRD